MDTFTGPAPHRPLSLSDPSEIRLVKLYPGKHEDPVRCVLENISLETNPEFIALSYTWGDPKTTSPIFLNGLNYEVTTNLKSFLQHIQALLNIIVQGTRSGENRKVAELIKTQAFLRDFLNTSCPSGRPPEAEFENGSSSSTIERYPNNSETTFLYLWIDAICINQGDIQERNSQVKKMKNIYRSASSTFVWLGDYHDISEDEIDNAFDFIIEVARLADPDVDSFNLERCARGFPEHEHRVNTELANAPTYLSQEDINKRAKAIRTIKDILRLPWFNRAWIVQEFALSQGPITAWCGYHHIPWIVLPVIDSLCDGILPIYEGIESREITFLPRTGIGALRLVIIQEWHMELKDRRSASEDENNRFMASIWLEMIEHLECNFNATDLCDAVFAFLGLLDIGGTLPDIPIDYALPWGVLYQRCAIFLLTHAKESINILLTASPLKISNVPSLIPSWVPDWRYFRPASGHQFTTPAYVEISPDGNELTLRGVRLGSVKSMVRDNSVNTAAGINPGANLMSSIPTLGIALWNLENICWRGLLSLHPQTTYLEFRDRWARLWHAKEEYMHFYDILTGQKEPQTHEHNIGLIGSGLFNILPLIGIQSELGIGLVDGGHLVSGSPSKPVMTDDMIFVFQGVSSPCILRRRIDGKGFEFRGICREHSWSLHFDEEWYNQQKVEDVILT